MFVITPAETQGSNHCIICEGGIDRHTHKMTVDTLFDIELPGHYLDGRKYVCQGCVQDIVRTCGLMQATEVTDLQEELRIFRAGYQSLLDHLRGHLNVLGDELTRLPVVPNVDFAKPNPLVVALEDETNKPKRGRPAKEPTF